MSIKVALEHRTRYRFARRVQAGPHIVRLRPAPHARMAIEAYSLTVKPDGHFLNWQQDPFGNWQARLVFPEPVEELDFRVGMVVDLTAINPLDFFVEKSAETFPFDYDAETKADLAPYLTQVREAEQAAQWRQALGEREGVPIVDFLAGLNAAVHASVAYSVRMEIGVQNPDETLAAGIGSCRDSAWLLVALLRQYGLAARFVSGYLVQLAPDEAVAQAALGGPTGPTADFTDLHAWAEVYIPGAGWIGMDPTSALFAGEGHIPLAATPHPVSAAPITGATESVEVEFSFSNEVRRIHEDPRVTAPYSAAQWAEIDLLGESVDAGLDAADVRLTMGGEPTFVSVDDMESEQWTTAADGPDKRRLAGELAARLRETYARSGVVNRGQGKSNPGEPLPRWQIALQWRTDGVPLWKAHDSFADPWLPEERDTGAGDAAERLAREIVRLLGLPTEQLLPAFEDPLLKLAAEVRRPMGAPTDTAEQAVSVEALDAQVSEPTAWVLPLATGESWKSPAWRFRRGRLVLTPGDSAAGLRLPLDAISWSDPEASGDPGYLEAGPPLVADVPTVEVVDPEGKPTTALAIEARDGFVHVFLPPTERLEDYISLLAIVEQAVVGTDTRVVLEGYGPPPDPRLTQLVVTPDPGVIEVNVQPSGSWSELRALTNTLYDAALVTRLGTEKFDLDGVHTGTGGGNHITIGGSQPVDSPLLRRPELLARVVRYWQRHPSLSYLFSGRFIGPTSQAPRFDEGRPEAVYEMSIALDEIARLTSGKSEPFRRPWLVDRALRHLLTDLTGNTHRAELCIDKLYSPDTSRGRLGLLELRGFEMPPHPQMSLVQALLVRALVLRLWTTEYDEPLIRWGTRLHDEFLLPHGVIADIRAVVRDLRDHGIAFQEDWLEPFFEFRFPRLGLARVDGVELELRAAIEPWNVLGDEAAGSGTARYVDSSVERLQLTVRGMDPDRCLVTCQGVPVPLSSTGTPGEHIAGVRYRAWQPPSALHPSIEVHAPLTFEVIDLVSAVSLGGCRYHVVHPGGRAYEVFPVNAQAAESRRSSRFEPFGHTPGRVDPAALRAGASDRSVDYPLTLDLRRHIRTRADDPRRGSRPRGPLKDGTA
jgi:uncharacterized protein (DUF2126 family)/transglutaminase-like putative cysteine protease